MDINYNDIEEKLEFYCHKCHRGIDLPPVQTNVKYCSYCGHEKKSSFDLPFFEYRKDKKTDEYYCGCKGWD